MKPISKEALWATNIASSQNSLNLGITAASEGASFNILSVIPVKLIINWDKGTPGLINASKVSMTFPLYILTAANSMILS